MSLAFSFTFLDFLVFKHAECRLKRFKRLAAVKKIDYSLLYSLLAGGGVNCEMMPPPPVVCIKAGLYNSSQTLQLGVVKLKDIF